MDWKFRNVIMLYLNYHAVGYLSFFVYEQYQIYIYNFLQSFEKVYFQ